MSDRNCEYRECEYPVTSNGGLAPGIPLWLATAEP